MRFERFFSLFAAVLQNAKSALSAPRAQRIVWALAVAIFLGGFAVSAAAKPELFAKLRYSPVLIMVFLLCPLMTAFNGLTTKILARAAGAEMSYSAALRLAVMSTAANHLPAPGGPLLRMAAFQAAGASLKNAGIANVALGLIWISATVLFAGACALFLDLHLAALFLGLGAVFFAAALLMGLKVPGGIASVGLLLAVSLASAALYAVSIYTALNAFDVTWPFPQAAVVAVAGVAGAASSIAPAGLGVREAAAAGLAVVIGAEAAAAFAATAIVHMAMLAVMGVCALFFAGRPDAAVAR